MNKLAALFAYGYQSLAGAWEIIKLNPQFTRYFDNSADGFWKSFWVIILVSPLFFLSFSLSYKTVATVMPQISPMVQIAEFFLRLPLLALALLFLTRFLRIAAYYGPMIIALNWLWALSSTLTLCLSLLSLTGILSNQIGMMLILAVGFYLEGYVVWFLFRQSLQISGWLAFGVTIFKLLFSLSVMQVMLYLFNL